MASTLRFGRIEIRPAERKLLVDAHAVEVGARAFDVLLALAAHRDRIVTKDELLEVVWPGVVVEENNLQVQVSALRRLLGTDAIATVPGRGYQFVLAEDPSPEAQGQPPAPRSARPGSYRKRAAAGAVAAVTVAAGFLFGDSAPLPRSGPLAIAVLPFANLTGRPDQEYIADALTLSLAADLQRLQDTTVIDPATAFAFKGKTTAMRDVHDVLGARFALQGSVQRADHRIRIQVHLADAMTRRQIWSEAFEGDAAEVLALQDRVTARVANSIGRVMVIAAARTSAQRGGDPDATDLMLRARAMDIGPRSLERVQQAERLYRRVVDLEPHRASAHAALAVNIVNQAVEYSFLFDEGRRTEMIEEAWARALRARELDPRHPGVFRPLSVRANWQGNRAEGRRILEEAVAMYPNNAIAHNNLAVQLLGDGEPGLALAAASRAIVLGPRSVPRGFLVNRGRAHFMLGDYDAAAADLVSAMQKGQDPTRMEMVFLALVHAERGDIEQAHSMTARLLRHSPDFRASAFEAPRPGHPPAYRQWFESRFLAGARKAGIPE